jgi:hypothetical protein
VLCERHPRFPAGRASSRTSRCAVTASCSLMSCARRVVVEPITSSSPTKPGSRSPHARTIHARAHPGRTWRIHPLMPPASQPANQPARAATLLARLVPWWVVVAGRPPFTPTSPLESDRKGGRAPIWPEHESSHGIMGGRDPPAGPGRDTARSTATRAPPAGARVTSRRIIIISTRVRGLRPADAPARTHPSPLGLIRFHRVDSDRN